MGEVMERYSRERAGQFSGPLERVPPQTAFEEHRQAIAGKVTARTGSPKDLRSSGHIYNGRKRFHSPSQMQSWRPPLENHNDSQDFPQEERQSILHDGLPLPQSHHSYAPDLHAINRRALAEPGWGDHRGLRDHIAPHSPVSISYVVSENRPPARTVRIRIIGGGNGVTIHL